MKPEQSEVLIQTLKLRFARNMHRHAAADWADVQARLQNRPDKQMSFWDMERTGGEPDVIAIPEDGGAYMFCDCSAESPQGRRLLTAHSPCLTWRRTDC